jgi:hypothetical protein
MVVLLGAKNSIPLYDDKAYLNNALVFGGRISKTAVQGPFAEERPPLLWWTLASLLSTGISLLAVNFLVPIYGLILILAVFTLAYEITNDLRIAIYSAIILGFNSFFLVFSSLLLSDIPGAALATVFMLCLYVGIVKHKQGYIIVAGPLLALNIIMRDQNLILIPIALVFAIFSLQLKRLSKVVLTIVVGVVLAVPIGKYGLIATLQSMSALLTPVVIGSPFKTPVTNVAVSYFIMYLAVITFFSLYGFVAINNANTSRWIKRCATLVLSGELLTLMIYPYLWDNFRLGAEYQIAGKGIFARLIAHDIMAITVGQGMNLPLSQRLSWWITGLPFILTPTLLILSIVGIVVLFRVKEKESARLLLPWFLLTIGFTLWQSQLEARYIALSVPPMAIFAGVAARWLELKLRGYFKALVLPAILLSENIVMHSLSINLTWTAPLLADALQYFEAQPTGWWFTYMRTIHGGGQLILDPVYVLVAVVGIIIPTAILVRQVSSILKEGSESKDSAISSKLGRLEGPTQGLFPFQKLLTSGTVTCVYCGRQVPKESRYCDGCGRPVLA